MIEPDSTVRVPPLEGAPDSFGPNALQILTTEHWSLLAARSLVYSEAMSRTSIFVAALTGSVVSLALVSQAADFGDGFVAFALVLLPVVFFLGVATFARLIQVNLEDATWVQGMNRIRNAYLQLEPELEPYFVTSHYDDDLGVLRSSVAMRRFPGPGQGFVAVPGVVGIMTSVVAGATAGIAMIGLDVGTAGALGVGATFFLAAVAFFAAWGWRNVRAYREGITPLFATPGN